MKKEEQVFKPSPEFKKEAHFSSFNQYRNVYDYSIKNREKFWSSEAKELYWFKHWKEVKQGKAFNSKWFVGGSTNISFNCIDRHIKTDRRNKAAIIWESESGRTQILTYQLLFSQVCKFANVLKKLGIKKGEFVAIYMGNVPEALIAMLGCARIGAVHTFIYHGLSPLAIKERVANINCKLIIAQDFVVNKGERKSLIEKVNVAIGKNGSIKNLIIYRRFDHPEIGLTPGRDLLWQDLMNKASIDNEPAAIDSQHPLFCMFTNGPKGDLVKILHRTGGFMVQSYLTTKWVFDLKDEDIFWSDSNIAWISGHAYGLYGPLLNGATTFMYEGVPIYPEPDRYWQLISKYRINILYTGPTTLRAFLKLGSDWVFRHDISSLRLLGVKGEPIKPETWLWFYEIIGKKVCPVVNTWLQTETGAILISPLPGAAEMNPGRTGYSFPGVEIDVVDINGNSVSAGKGGYLIIKDSWPSLFTTGKDEKQEVKLNSWNILKGNYFTGDAVIKERNGFVRVLGRVDDVIKAAGNRIGGTQIERILLNHESVKETAVVKRPDEVIGNAIIAFVVLKNEEGTPLLREELRSYVEINIGSIAKPDELIFLDEMPKLSNGKTNRQLLRKQALEKIAPLKGKEAEDFEILEILREEYQRIYLT